MPEGDFTIIGWILYKLGLDVSWTHYGHVVMGFIVFIIITLISLKIKISLRKPEDKIIPDEKITFLNMAELAVGAILNQMKEVLGDSAAKHLPFIGSLFIYILFSNLMGMIPGLLPPTDNINTNLACAAIVFIYYNVAGIKAHGFFKYLKHFAGPVLGLAPLMIPIELISHVVRPMSLSIRLTGNIAGDHIVLSTFSHIVPFVIPVVFMILALFVALIQAFIFSMLSMVYISLATAHEEH